MILEPHARVPLVMRPGTEIGGVRVLDRAKVCAFGHLQFSPYFWEVMRLGTEANKVRALDLGKICAFGRLLSMVFAVMAAMMRLGTKIGGVWALDCAKMCGMHASCLGRIRRLSFAFPACA